MSVSPDRAKQEQAPEAPAAPRENPGDYSAGPVVHGAAPGAQTAPLGAPTPAPSAQTASLGAPTLRLSIPASAAGLRLDAALAALLPQFSRSRLQAWLKQGAITVDGAQRAPSSKVDSGEAVRVDVQPEPQQLAWRAEERSLHIVHEDAALLVLNKPPGLVVHPGHGNWSGTLLNALLSHSPLASQLPRAGIVHRLDKETSGLMVVAKTLTAYTSLVRQLQARSVTRRYLAVVEGAPPMRGKVDAPIGRHPAQRTKMAVNERGRAALTEFRVLERLGAYSLLELKLHTGRTHQIRVHMQSLRYPLVGDPVYGARKRGPGGNGAAHVFARQALHAAALSLQHPDSGAALSWEAPLPHDMQALVEALREAPREALRDARRQ
jgi:23S rRNA pseudouridine1911/1915/1917 synthase